MKRTTTLIFASLISLGLGCDVDACTGDQCNQTNTSGGTDSTDGTDGADASESGSLADAEAAKITAIGGVVRDANTLAALQGVLISTDPPTGSVITNANGEFVIDITSNPTLENFEGSNIRVNANKVGYTANFANLLVAKGQLAKSDILMTKAATEFNIEVTPQTIQFNDSDFFETDTASKSITVKLVNSPNVQNASVSVEVPVEAAVWLSATPTQATLDGSPKTIVVTIDRSKLKNGTRTSEIRFTAAGATELTTLQVSYTRTDAGGGDGADATDGADGSSDGADATDGTDGSTDATDGTDGATDATDGTDAQ